MFDFIMQQILGMQWLSKLIWQLLESILGATQASPLWGSVHFFLYDTIKISILLVSLIFMITYIQSYFPPEKTKRILTGFRGVKGAIIAALLGTVTPFCSCSSIPIFIGFTRAGLPLGMTFSFLISSPGGLGLHAHADELFWQQFRCSLCGYGLGFGGGRWAFNRCSGYGALSAPI